MTTPLLTVLDFVYSGEATFPLNFPLGILSRTHVTVQVNSKVDTNNAPRKYADITRENLDQQAKQALMVYHEALDGRIDGIDVSSTLETVQSLINSFTAQYTGEPDLTLQEVLSNSLANQALVTEVDPSTDVLLQFNFGSSNNEGVPVSITGGTTFQGPAPNTRTVGTTTYDLVAWDLKSRNAVRSARANSICFQTEVVRKYEERQANGDNLPPLVSVNISLGGSGFVSAWSMDMKTIGGDTLRVPGENNVGGDISLWSLAHQVIPHVIRQLLLF